MNRNPISPDTYARAAIASTFWLAPIYLLAGFVTNLVAGEPGRGFFDLHVQLGPHDVSGAPFWLFALCALFVGHGLAVKRFAFAAATVTRDPWSWFGIHVPYPALGLLAADIVMCALIPPTFYVVRNSTWCC